MSRLRSMTYGQLPSQEEFDAAFDAQNKAGELRGGKYHVTLGRSDSRAADGTSFGDDAYNASELYRAVCELAKKWQGGKGSGRWTRKERDAAGDLVSSVLETLGFEWI